MKDIKFYLSILIFDKYLKNKWLLIDEYKNSINQITKDYIEYDNKKKSLLDSINDYIELKNDFILETLKNCIED